MTRHEAIVIGAGLAGLSAARRLQANGVETVVVEARERPGGRILSVTPPGAQGIYDLGPAWFWPGQPHVAGLVDEAGLAVFEQYETGLAVVERDRREPPQVFPPNWQQPVSYRIDDGVGALISFLHQQLVVDSVRVDHRVESISQEDGCLALHVSHDGDALHLRAQHVVMTLPPHLAATTVRYGPPLPANVETALLATPTWMGRAMKVVITYSEPFWRRRGLSGMGLSYAGPVQQFHDASPRDGAGGALFGWIGDDSSVRDVAIGERQDAVIDQVTRLFGAAGVHPTGYAEMNWARERFTNGPRPGPHAGQHPRYGHPLLQEPQLAGRLFWAGTEVSPVSGGYLDGAIASGLRVAANVLDKRAGLL
jgi:monoamine oxidase